MNSSLGGNIGIYLIDNDGLTIYSQSIGEDIDPQLIGGLSVAILNFSSSVYGYKQKPDFINIKSSINSDLLENRLMTGERVHCLLLLKNVANLSDDAYSELDELSKLIINHVEKDYDDLSFNGSSLKVLDNFVYEHINLMKEEIYSSYLLNILSKAINYNVKKNKSEELIPLINKAYQLNNCELIHEKNNEIKKEIIKLTEEERSKTFKGIIKQVNEHYKPVWSLFKVPLIKID